MFFHFVLFVWLCQWNVCETRLQKADPQFIYAQAQCFFVPRLSSYDISREAVFFPSFWVTMPGRETSKICTWSLTPGPPISMLISYRLLKQKYIYVAADKIDFVGCQAFLNNIEIGVRGGKQ